MLFKVDSIMQTADVLGASGMVAAVKSLQKHTTTESISGVVGTEYDPDEGDMRIVAAYMIGHESSWHSAAEGLDFL